MAAGFPEINSGETWVRSSHCGPKNNCVELGGCDISVIIRDSKSEATLHPFSNAGWTTFLAHCQAAD